MKMKLLRSLSLVMTVAVCLGMLVGAGSVFAAENNYLAVTERANYPSGVYFLSDPEVQLIGGHEYTLDIDIAVISPQAQTLRVLVNDTALRNITTGAQADAGGKRGLEMKTGWNELRDLKFTAKTTSRFTVLIHSDAFGTEDFFIDNLRIYDLTDSKEVVKIDFEDKSHYDFFFGPKQGFGEEQTITPMKGELPVYVLPVIPEVEDLDRITTADDYYLEITERVHYASGIVINPGVNAVKKHYYRVDVNIYVAQDSKIRILAQTSNGGDVTFEAGSDLNGVRGIDLKAGWNTLTNYTFTATGNDPFVIKIHNDSSGECDMYIDNFYLRDVTDKVDILTWAFDDGEILRSITGMSYPGASQRITMRGIELPKWSPEDELQYEVGGIVINEDFDSLSSMDASTTADTIRNFVKTWEGSHVTDYMLNVFSQIPAYPSDVTTDLLDKYYRTEEQGMKVDYKYDKDVSSAKIMFEDKGIDYIAIMMEELPKVGINPWLSYRMNDAHNIAYKETMFHYTDFFYANPQFRRVQHGSTINTYYGGLLDYSHEEVRDYWLAIFNEALSKYDCYGLELDFQREIWLWHMGGEYNGLDYLNDFMRQLDGIISIYEEKYGHEIKVAVRVAQDIQTNYDLGLDVITWASEGLIDLINPTSRYMSTDFDVPVRMWASVMHPYGVEVAPGLETIILGDLGGQTPRSDLPTAAAAAANWYAQGADKLYLYNHFLRCGTAGFSESDRETLDLSVTSFTTPNGRWRAMTTLGSYEEVMSLDRRMILTYSDTYAYWKTDNKQLPARAYPNSTPASIRMPVGIIPEGSEAIFNIAVNAQNVKKYPTVTINGKQAEYIGVYSETGNDYVDHTILSYKIPASAYDDMYLIAEMVTSSGKYLAVSYVDVTINVAK